MHWLAAAAGRGGVAGADKIHVPAEATLADAWRMVAGALHLTTTELAAHVAAAYRLRVADLDGWEPQALKLLPEKIARKYRVFPLRESDRHLVLAGSDPTNFELEQAIAFASGRRPILEIASPEGVEDALNTRYSPDNTVKRLLSGVEAELADAVRVVAELQPEIVSLAEIEATPVVRLTNLILRDAIVQGASDIHIEPGPRGGTVRFRIDGVMRTYAQLPMAALNRIVSRVKVLGKLDIADRLRPQDGRTRVAIDEHAFDMRISTVPTREAEKVVVRILSSAGHRRLAETGLPARELARLQQLLLYREGIVLVTGPTGSGKTTTLYSAIRELATGSINIMTVEDPIEYELPGITQIQVEPKRDVTFAKALRAILRQDPDVIFVGEIRDRETAEVAAHASMTGHLVLATLHTNDAIGVVPRLSDLGLDDATIAATLRGMLAQRLLRKICPKCSLPATGASSAEERRLESVYAVKQTVRAVGCVECGGTGYRGRIPLVEVVLCNPSFTEMIASGATTGAMRRAAAASGTRWLREVGLDRITAGDTTLEEVERVLGEAIDDSTPEVHGPAKVLVVDDDEIERTLVRSILEREGFQVTEVGNGGEAMTRIVAGDEFNLIITDLQMPEMDGEALLGRLRITRATANVPVIVLTGTGDREAEVRLMEEGADDYIQKPIDPMRLIARTRATLRRSGFVS